MNEELLRSLDAFRPEPVDANLPVEERLRRVLERQGAIRCAERVSDLRQDSIRIETEAAEDASIPVGASKFGGLPDLPPSLEWPRWREDAGRVDRWLHEDEGYDPKWFDGLVSKPLSFLAQVNMCDASQHDEEHLLPNVGMLYFFYDAEVQPGGMAPDDTGGHRVLYYDGDLASLRRAEAPVGLPEGEPFPAYTLQFRKESTLPDSESPSLPVFGFSEDERDQYVDGLIALGDVDYYYGTPDEKIHRMLGHPDTQQGDIYVWCELKSSNESSDAWKNPDVLKRAVDWRLLLQVDSMEELHATEEGAEYRGWMWGDLGRIYYTIRKEDLEVCDFSKVMLMHQCG